MDPNEDTFDARSEIKKLARSIYRLKMLLGCTLGALALVGLCAFKQVNGSSATQEVTDVVTSKKFVLVDNDGTTLAVLEPTATGSDLTMYAKRPYQYRAVVKIEVVAPSAPPNDSGWAGITLAINNPMPQWNGKPLPPTLYTSSFRANVDGAGAHAALGEEFYPHGTGQGDLPQASVDAGPTKVGFSACTDRSKPSTCSALHL
jgi:hypothetical protein